MLKIGELRPHTPREGLLEPTMKVVMLAIRKQEPSPLDGF